MNISSIKVNRDRKFRPYLSYILLIGSIILTTTVVIILYKNTQDLFKQSLQSQVEGIATTASLQFKSSTLDLITDKKSLNTKVYIETVKELQRIRSQNPGLKFIYIQRRTDNENVLEFVADADSMHPDIPIDLNGDGEINDEDALNYPGEIYDVSDYPEFARVAFSKSYVDEELSIDQWGTHLSATAPINEGNQGLNAKYLVGIDMDVSDFVRLTNLTLVPFILFTVLLLLILTAQTVLLVHLWGNQLKLLQQLDKQKDELLSIVSHQLATPVSSIKWYLEMLLDGDVGVLSKEQQDYLSTMQSVTRDLSDLVSMILDVSRIQLGKMKVDRQKIELNKFFEEIFVVIDPKAKEKEINFIKEIPENIPTASLDKRLMRMTIENLLTNAIKYTPNKGDVKMTVKLMKDGRAMHLEIKDTGIGIPQKDKDKMFSKQFRASNTGSIDGNGFGLYVAKGAIEGQGGKIWFESEEGKGTTFFVDLPLS